MAQKKTVKRKLSSYGGKVQYYTAVVHSRPLREFRYAAVRKIVSTGREYIDSVVHSVVAEWLAVHRDEQNRRVIRTIRRRGQGPHRGGAVMVRVKRQPIDLVVHGNLGFYLLSPTSAQGQGWIDEHIAADAPRLGDSVAVDHHRYLEDIVEGAQGDGLRVEAR